MPNFLVKACFHFGEFGRPKRNDRMLKHLKEAIWLAVAHSDSEKVELDLTPRTGRTFACERLFSTWISSYASPDIPLLGRATEFAEIETGLTKWWKIQFL